MRNYVIISMLFVLVFVSCTTGNVVKNDEKVKEYVELSSDLKLYPLFFTQSENFSGDIIIDDFAGSMDIGSAQILMNSFENSPEIKKYPSERRSLEDGNAILIGSCSQEPHNLFVNVYTDCLSFRKNQAIIRIVNHNDNWLLYVVGENENATRNAINVLINFDDYDLKGEDVEVMLVNGSLRIGGVS